MLINPNDILNFYYRIDEVLTSGAGGDLFVGVDQRSQKKYFIKIPAAPKYPASTLSGTEKKKREFTQYMADWTCKIKLLVTLSSTHDLIPVVNIFKERNLFPVLISPYVSELVDIENDNLSTDDKVSFTRTALDQLSALHEAGLVHADIKPGNVMFDPNRKSARMLDFDGSFFYKLPPSPERHVGDPAYMAPEVIDYCNGYTKTIGKPIDVFSLGLLLIRLWTGRLPESEDQSPIAEMLQNGFDLKHWLRGQGIPNNMYDLLASMVETNPETRAESSTLMQFVP